MDWNSTITDDVERREFTTLPAGDYWFTVEDLERAEWGGSAKIPAGTPKASLTLGVDYNGEHVKVRTSLFLIESAKWKIFNLMESVGLKSPDQREFNMGYAWDHLCGRRGKAHIGPRTYIGNDGEQHTANDVKRFLVDKSAPVASPVIQPPTASYTDIPF